MHANIPHMEQTVGLQANLCASYGENLASTNNETTVSMWQLASAYLKRHACFKVFFLSPSLCDFYLYLYDHNLSCLPCTWWKFPSSLLLHCARTCAYVLAFRWGGHSLGPCVILFSLSHGLCEIPTPVERIILTLCECVPVHKCVHVCASGPAWRSKGYFKVLQFY